MELFHANKQWATRPDDERFPTIQTLYDATKAYAATAREQDVNFSDLRMEAMGGDVQLVGRKGVPAKLTNWAFSQVCARLGAPASYLRDLPATLAVQNLNHGLAARAKAIIEAAASPVARLLFHQNGGLLLRALTSDSYSRIWNWEVAERLLDLQGKGWEPAVPDFNSFDDGKRTALYASDHDMFAFLRLPKVAIKEAGTTEPLYRGLIVKNSEVGAGTIGAMRFFYRAMCGNHIIWGASEVVEINLRHVGSVRERFGMFAAQITKYANESVSEDEAKIAAAKTRMIAATKEEVLDALFGKRGIGLSRKALEAGYEAVNEAEDGDPRTAWGFAQGLTRHSQTLPYADKRVEMDTAAGRILDVF